MSFLPVVWWRLTAAYVCSCVSNYSLIETGNNLFQSIKKDHKVVFFNFSLDIVEKINIYTRIINLNKFNLLFSGFIQKKG